MRGDRRGTLLSIQWLRGLAAMMVVLHHARNPQDWLFNPMANLDFLGSSVDMFFVISGFIIFYSARGEEPAEYARRRLVRIVPLYWIATGVWLAMNVGMWQIPVTVPVEWNLLKSLLFIPTYNVLDDPTQIWPLLVPGWTLNYEMFFYALFGIGLIVKRPLAVITVTILILAVIGFFTDPHGAIPQVYTRYWLLDFLAGAWIGKFYTRYDFRRHAWMLPAALVFILFSDAIPYGPYLTPIAAMMTIMGGLALEDRGMVPGWRLPVLFGNASYSIYLFHIPALAIVLTYAWQFPLGGWLQFVTVVGLGAGASAIAGIAIHYAVEKPLLRLMNRMTVAMIGRNRREAAATILPAV